MAMIEQTAPNVGRRIRALREKQGLSLRALSEVAGLSTNAISLIERGENSPTVSSLHLLATGLGVAIADFFTDDTTQNAVFVRAEARLRSEAHGILMESLGSGLPEQQLAPFFVTLEPGAGNLDQPVSHPGEEMVLCLSGEIDYSLPDQSYRLTAGDSLVFDATQPHCFCNPSPAEPAQFVVVFNARGGGNLAHQLHVEATENSR